MLAVNKYSRDYVDASKAKVDRFIAAYDKAAGGIAGPARETLETEMFRNMVLALDGYFANRLRAGEGKDGNPLNEVRMLCDGLTNGEAVFARNNTIRYDPAKSVLGLAYGDLIRLSAADFARLAKAFFAEIEARFV
jgi:hypothetical protein